MKLANIPFLIAYIVYPVVMLSARLTGFNISRNWIDVAWIILSCLSLAVIIWRLSIKTPQITKILYFSIIFFCLSLSKVIQSYIADSYDLIPLLMTLKPVFYFVVAILWVSAFGIGDSRGIVILGCILSAIIFFELFSLWIFKSQFIRPRGSGEINYDALLILISWVVACSYTSFWKRLPFLVLTFGLLICFSRTALFAAALALLVGKNIPIWVRSLVISLAVIFILGSFVIRDLPLDSLERADRVWMWLSAIDLLSDFPVNLFVGFRLGQNLPIIAPDNIRGLWEYQSNEWGLNGVFSFHYHSFWLRFIIDWGMAITTVVAGWLVWLLFSRSSCVVERRLALITSIAGLTMGLLYLSNVGVPLLLAFFIFYNARLKLRNGIHANNY